MASNEIVPYEEGVIPSSFLFPFILDGIKNDLPISLLSAEQDGESAHYVLRALESSRVLSIIEKRQSSESVQWFAQTFCIKLGDSEGGEAIDLHSSRNQQMAAETVESPRDMDSIYELISKLRFGYGTGSDLRYLRGYDDESRIGWSDAFQVSFREQEYETEDSQVVDNPISVVEDALIGAEEEVSALVYDIAKHMTELGRVVEMIRGDIFVYRTRFDNYPLAPGVVDDLVLVYSPEGGVWYRGSMARQDEVSIGLLSSICDYQNMIIPIEIPAFIYGGIQAKLGDIGLSEQVKTS